MALVDLVEILKNVNWFNLIVKIIGILFSIGYFIYAILYHQQLIKMEKNALIYYHLLNNPGSTEKPAKPLLFSFSMLQLLLGLVLVVISLLII